MLKRLVAVINVMQPAYCNLVAQPVGNPLSKDRQSDDLTGGKRGQWPWMPGWFVCILLTKVIDHHVQCRQEGIHFYHCELLFGFVQAHFRGGYLLFQVLSNSHQTFKYVACWGLLFAATSSEQSLLHCHILLAVTRGGWRGTLRSALAPLMSEKMYSYSR